MKKWENSSLLPEKTNIFIFHDQIWKFAVFEILSRKTEKFQISPSFPPPHKSI